MLSKNSTNGLFVAVMILSILLLGGCEKEVKLKYKKGTYKTSECLKELGSGDHFLEDKSVDKIVVSKKDRKLYLYRDDKVHYSFNISLGKNPNGDKMQQGDFRTPEGSYAITRKKCHPKYYRMIFISYPNRSDRMDARKRGVSPGSGITIHAQPFWNADGKGDEYTLSHDWTNGCIAVTNRAMDVLWYAVRSGTPIKIVA